MDATASALSAARWLFQSIAELPRSMIGLEVSDETKPAAQPSPAPYDGRIDEDTVRWAEQPLGDLGRRTFRLSTLAVIRPDGFRHDDRLRRFRPLCGSHYTICNTYRHEHQKHRKRRKRRSFLGSSHRKADGLEIAAEFEAVSITLNQPQVKRQVDDFRQRYGDYSTFVQTHRHRPQVHIPSTLHPYWRFRNS